LDVLVFAEKEEAELGEAAVVEFVKRAVEKRADVVVESGVGHLFEVCGISPDVHSMAYQRGERKPSALVASLSIPY
jgi:hypothetical protein